MPGAVVAAWAFLACAAVPLSAGAGYLAHWLLRSIGRHQ